MSTAPALQATGLTKTYDDLVALHPLDLTVTRGESVALIGHNGSGKSTFLRMVAGLLEPSDGDVEIAGSAGGDSRPGRPRRSSPTTRCSTTTCRVREHVEYVVAAARRRRAGTTTPRASLERLGLIDRVDDLPSRFSRGLRQKTSIVLGAGPAVLAAARRRALRRPRRARQGRCSSCSTRSTPTAPPSWSPPTSPRSSTGSTGCIALRDGEVIFDGKASVDQVLRLVGG